MVDWADDPGGELRRKLAATRWVALLESISYVLLAAFWLSGNKIGKLLMGSIHGWVFLLFAAMMLGLWRPMRWRWTFVVFCVLAGPVGPLYAFEKLKRAEVPVAGGRPAAQPG
jgi:integral membrane protein